MWLPCPHLEGATQICVHRRRREWCKDCGGSGLCEHGKRRTRCKLCPAGRMGFWNGCVCALFERFDRREGVGIDVATTGTLESTLHSKAVMSGRTYRRCRGLR
eukprot:1570561-Rhodomonas_salina.2